jgi:DNA-binding NarL/FixJ family response regulator
MTIRLLVFVQEATFADALAARLEAEPDIEVMAALYLRDPLPQLLVSSHADVVLLDGDLPGDVAFVLSEELRQRGDTPKIVFISRTSNPQRITRAITAGAVGWVGKSDSLDRLIEVIRGVARGEIWLPPAETGPVLQLLMGIPNPEQDNSGRLIAALTPREREVLACLAEGVCRRDLAERLHMSPNTVRTHLQNLMVKLGVHSALEAVALIRSLSAAHSPNDALSDERPSDEWRYTTRSPAGARPVKFSLSNDFLGLAWQAGHYEGRSPLETPIAANHSTSDGGCA